MFSQIVAIAQNCGIGYKNNLLCPISEDLKYLKRITLGHTIIMGRNTFKSLPRVLPDRKSVVLTHWDFKAPAGVSVAHDIAGLLNAYQDSPEQSFIIGGASVYAQSLPYCSKLYVTRIHALFPADAFYPYDFEDGFDLEYKSDVMTDEKSGVPFEFTIYGRKRQNP